MSVFPEERQPEAAVSTPEMVNVCGTCQQPLHSCLGDRCQWQGEKPALLGLRVLVPVLPIDLPTWKGEPGPVH